MVGNTHDGGLSREPGSLMIVPDAQVSDALTGLNARILPMMWVVRTHGDPRLLANVVTEQLRQASGGFPVARVRTMDEIVVRSTSRAELQHAAVDDLRRGRAGVWRRSVFMDSWPTRCSSARRRWGSAWRWERTARKIRNLVVWHGMRLAFVGVILGIGAAFGLTRLIASFLFGVKSWDPLVFVAVPVILSAVALLAVWLPATRAARLDPMQALRVE